MSESIVRTDERGIWIHTAEGTEYGIEWAEIYRVSGGKIDCIDSLATTVELDFEYGEYIELHPEWPGFRAAVEAINSRLPGIDPTWFARIDALGKDDPWLTVWCRDPTLAA
jgi:hypothetical protein